jgi:cytochrome c55X
MKTFLILWNFPQESSFRGSLAVFGLVSFVLMSAIPASAEIDIPRQKELLYFLKHDCGSCHGLTRSGGLGSPLLPEVMADRSDDELTEIIMEGLPGTPMPPWKALLSEEEARWLVRAIKENKWQK